MRNSDSLWPLLVLDEAGAVVYSSQSGGDILFQHCVLLITVESDNKKERKSAKAAKGKGDQSKAIKVVSQLNESLAGKAV